mmetsp:Transcript_6425/g.14294  ORF Transcript_6425/g.14294 Transcript_6425/m.14294 type:complete len:236 (+) Transcript_6425:72-779(+)|eukprot:CAMPEP_0202905666 /NCGR_PEP_ID=MMETSP1392-20130828/35485_1 /ASSEMBLY_ACC=CAM_ASM_000868 /TAXON_ID=225041 /ORGANISM="Chlamydomonas chlamydogama, Strain SAG 11-48b" /LENGTH=235 /DNA_ID=CAMNT_0049593869 /DNA_START=58 /DNA_END=765 /DNA_ORIENTATION=-
MIATRWRVQNLHHFGRSLTKRSASHFLSRATAQPGSMGDHQKRVFNINANSILVLSQGDITKYEGDAIVNAANQRMLGGGGVDGAIHRAAGPELLEACRQVPEIRPGLRCPTGEARITGGFNLRAQHVIHTVGPIYETPAESAPLLANAYKNSLKLANEHNLRTVAFPAISTGVYGYPVHEAAQVSLKAVSENVGTVAEVHFVLFGMPTFNAFLEAAENLFGEATAQCANDGAPK